MLSNGDVVLSGFGGAGGDIVAIRLNADGSLDTGYGGGDGISQLVNVSGGDAGVSSHLLAGDKVLVAGTSGPGDVAVVRFNSDGTLDTTYGGGDGIVATDLGGVDYSWGGSVLLSDDKLLVGAVGGATDDVYMVRYLPDGSLDPSYGGGDGISSAINGGGVEFVYRAHVVQDQGVVVTGYGGAGNDFLAVKFDSTGVSQYLDGTSDWDTAGGGIGLFGACLRSVANGATSGGSAWTEGPGNACPATDGAYWNAIPASSPGSKIAYTSAPDAQGGSDPTTNIRFGFRAKSNQPPGTYHAPVVFEVTAPNA